MYGWGKAEKGDGDPISFVAQFELQSLGSGELLKNQIQQREIGGKVRERRKDKLAKCSVGGYGAVYDKA